MSEAIMFKCKKQNENVNNDWELPIPTITNISDDMM